MDRAAIREASGAGRHTASRRGFCCGAATAVLCCLPGLKAQARLLRDRPLALEQVADGVHVSQNLGAICNIGFIVGDRSVAVIDSGGCRLWGEKLRQALRAVTDRPISHVVQTHVHPDHIFGSAAFLDDRPVFLGHAKLARALANRGPFYLERLREALGDLADGSVVVPPNQVVETEAEIDLGNRVLRVTAYPTAHTDNDLSLFDERTGTLWAGDLVFMERTPVMDGSINGWLQVTAGMTQVVAARVVPGHGPAAAPWPDAAAAQTRYLTLLRDEIRALLEAGGTMEQAVSQVAQSERSAWALFDDYNPRNAIAAFAELEWE